MSPSLSKATSEAELALIKQQSLVESEAEARELVIDCCIGMRDAGLVLGSAGNVSLRLGSGELCVTPAGVPYDRLTAEELPIVDPLTGRWRGNLRPTSEIALHTELMGHFTDVRAIVHTHSRYAAAFAVAHRDIPFICNESLGTRADRILVTRFAPPGSAELAERVFEAFARQPGSRAVLLANHGVVAAGSTLPEALLVAAQVEWVAEVAYRAEQLGGAIPISREGQLAMAQNYGTYINCEDIE